MNDKKNPFDEIITAEEKKILLGGASGYLQLSSLPEALRDKTPAFKAYLAVYYATCVLRFCCILRRSSLSAYPYRSATPLTLLTFRFIRLRVFLGLLLVAGFYYRLLLRREVVSLLVSYCGAMRLLYWRQERLRLLRLLPEPGLGFYMYVLTWLVAIILLLLFAREAAR